MNRSNPTSRQLPAFFCLLGYATLGGVEACGSADDGPASSESRGGTPSINGGAGGNSGSSATGSTDLRGGGGGSKLGSSAASGGAGGLTASKGGDAAIGGADSVQTFGGGANVGGTANTGASTSRGGAASVGGSASRGGAASVGGSAPKGGAASVGGSVSKGGASGTGGATAGASGATVTGFASIASSGLSTTTGGGTVSPTIVTTCASLKSLLEDASSRVLEIPAGTTMDCRSTSKPVSACELKCSSTSSKVFWRVPVGDQTCTSLADFNGDGTLDVPAGTMVNKTRSDFAINVNSNKTLRGAGSGATLKGVSLNIDSRSNVIVRNLTFTQVNPDLIEAGDGITINSSHHVWVDHCAFSMISDGYLDIRYGSSAVTVSHNRIDGANSYVCGGQHNFVSLVSDSSVTYHHNVFDRVGGRNPKVTGTSQVHLYSNYYLGVSYFCASSGAGAALLVEGNYYQDSRYPHWAEGGSIEARGNQYGGTTSSAGRDDNADVFNPPYTYQIDTVSSLPQTLTGVAGPRAL